MTSKYYFNRSTSTFIFFCNVYFSCTMEFCFLQSVRILY